MTAWSASLERRHARAGSLRAPARQAVENEVDRSRRRGATGAARAASATCWTPESASTRPAYMAAPSASRYVSRANAGSSASSRLAASRRSGGPSLPRVKTNAICARSRCSSRALKLVQRSELGRREQRLGGLAASRLQLGLRGGERARPASCRVRGQLGRSLQERGRGRNAAAAAGAVGRALQLIGDRLVEPGCSVRAMPCAAIRIRLGIRRFGQRAMHLSGVRAPLPPGTPPSAPADGGSAPGRRARSAPPPRPARSLRPRSRVARPRATTT